MAVQAKDRWFIDNVVDRASLTGPSVTPALGPDRLRDPRVGAVWRPEATGTVLTVVFPIPTPVDVIGLFGLSKTLSQAFTLTLTSATGTVDPRSGPWTPVVDPYARQAIWLPDTPATPPASVSRVDLRIDGEVSDIGRLWIGALHWQPKVNHIYGATLGAEDLSVVVRGTRSGAVFTSTARKLRMMDLVYGAIYPDEAENQVRTLQLGAGTSKQVLFIPDPAVYDMNKAAILGYMPTVNPIATLGFQRHQKAFSLKEAG